MNKKEVLSPQEAQELIAKLKIAQDYAESIVETIRESLVVLDKSLKIISVNRSFYDFFRTSPEETIGRFIYEIGNGQWDIPELRKLLEEILPLENPFNGYKVEHDFNEIGHKIMLLNAREIHREGQGLDIILLAFEDVTDHTLVEELRRARMVAESANFVKGQFLSNMSHEIRTPMNAIIGILQLLQMTDLNEEQQGYVDVAKKSGFYLVQLLGEILELSKIEAGKIELEKCEFDLFQTISSIANLLSLQASEKGIELISSIDPDVPIYLRGDVGRLRQIIINLMGNAIKFTSRGVVTVRASKEFEDENFVGLRFLVCDSGIGIDSNKLARMFEPFTQENDSTSREYGGTGLGLSISRQLIELMDGKIGVDSEKGKGSTFWFTITLEKKNGDVKPAIKTFEKVGPGIVNHHILLVEDEEVNQKIIFNLLKYYGYQVDMVSSGLEALIALEKKDYDLVLMDCMMPEMDGYQTTLNIRDPVSAVSQHEIPIIALTGNVAKKDIENCLMVGMNDYLAKPIILEQLLEKLQIWILK